MLAHARAAGFPWRTSSRPQGAVGQPRGGGRGGGGRGAGRRPRRATWPAGRRHGEPGPDPGRDRRRPGALARAIAAGGWAAPILSLAGLTEAAPVEGVVMRSGGFGGPEGLTRLSARHRRRRGVRRHPPVCGADHRACRARLRRRRRARASACSARLWQLQPGDRWHAVDTIAEGLALAAAAGAPGVRDARPQGAGGTGPGRRRSPSSCAESPGPRGRRNVVWVDGTAAVPGRGRGGAAAAARDRALFIQAQRRRADLRQDRGGARAGAAGGDADPASAARGCARARCRRRWPGWPASSAAGRA